MRNRNCKLVAALAAMLIICGCGRDAGYHFPEGKTLVYVVYESMGRIKEDGTEEETDPMAVLEVRLKVWNTVGNQKRITLSGHPPYDRSDMHLGKNLGEVVFDINEKGVKEIIRGKKIPTEIRYFVPTFPSPPRKGMTWEDEINVIYRQNGHNIKVRYEHMGTKKIGNNKCSWIEGTGSKQIHEEREDPSNMLYVEMDFDLSYKENYCIDFKKGYLVETDIEITRLRKIKDKSSSEFFINETDKIKNKVALERID